jgi:ABC-type transporter lipoprotein component MlaA
MYDVRGAAVAQVERDDINMLRPRTRLAVQRAHDRGEQHDYVELRDGWNERRDEQQRVIAMSQRDQRQRT